MASASTPYQINYTLIDKEDGLKKCLAELKCLPKPNSMLAVDCEGVNLSRKGELTIITVANEEKAYIFDVVKLKQGLFESGLGEILEDKSRVTLMFDCRQDSDSLWHQFRVKLTGVLDLQLLEVMHRRENTASGGIRTSQFKRRSQRLDEVENIYGFGRCIELYVKDENFIKAKEDGRTLLKHDEALWKLRPISERLLKYCAVDTLGLFKLYEKLKEATKGEDLSRLQVGSERYLELYRSKSERYYDDYECNAYLPLDVIPEKGSLSFPRATTQCIECLRLFPKEEFSFTQLRKSEQKCRVCKEVKRKEDEYESKIANWARQEEEPVVYGEFDTDYSFIHGHHPWESPSDSWW